MHEITRMPEAAESMIRHRHRRCCTGKTRCRDMMRGRCAARDAQAHAKRQMLRSMRGKRRRRPFMRGVMHPAEQILRHATTSAVFSHGERK